MDPVVQLVIALLGGANTIQGGVIAKLYLENKAKDLEIKALGEARLADTAKYAATMIDFHDRLREADAEEIARLRAESKERIDSIPDDNPPSKRKRLRA